MRKPTPLNRAGCQGTGVLGPLPCHLEILARPARREGRNSCRELRVLRCSL